MNKTHDDKPDDPTIKPLDEDVLVEICKVNGATLAVERLGESQLLVMTELLDFDIIEYEGESYKVLKPVDTRYPSAKDWHPLQSSESRDAVFQRLLEEKRMIELELTFTKEGSFGLMTFTPEVLLPPMRICVQSSYRIEFKVNRDELEMPIETYDRFVL